MIINACRNRVFPRKYITYVIQHSKFTFNRFSSEWIETLSVSHRQVSSYVERTVGTSKDAI